MSAIPVKTGLFANIEARIKKLLPKDTAGCQHEWQLTHVDPVTMAPKERQCTRCLQRQSCSELWTDIPNKQS